MFGRNRVNVLKIKPLTQYQPHKSFLKKKKNMNNKRAHFERISHLGSILAVIR